MGYLSLEADTSPQGFNDHIFHLHTFIYLLVAHDLSSLILAQCGVFGVYYEALFEFVYLHAQTLCQHFSGMIPSWTKMSSSRLFDLYKSHGLIGVSLVNDNSNI